jgi:putative ABC transport system substrate-binding protein
VTSGRRLALAGIAIAPFAVRAADAPPKKRLAILSLNEEVEAKAEFAGALKALAARGYVEGRNLEVILSYHYRKDGLDDRVRGLLAWKPDAILTGGTVATQWLVRETRTIPIVTTAADPVGAGFAASLARPGGNVTGLSRGGPEMATKTMEVLRMLMPRLSRMAFIFIDHPDGRLLSSFSEEAAKAAGLVAAQYPVKENEDLARLFQSIAASGCQAAYWGFVPMNDELVAIREALQARLALVSGAEYLTERGALVSFAAAERETFAERSADMLVKIFRGTPPGEIPFEYPRRFRFAINAATAARLGVKVTPDLRLRADRVIE